MAYTNGDIGGCACCNPTVPCAGGPCPIPAGTLTIACTGVSITCGPGQIGTINSSGALAYNPSPGFWRSGCIPITGTCTNGLAGVLFSCSDPLYGSYAIQFSTYASSAGGCVGAGTLLGCNATNITSHSCSPFSATYHCGGGTITLTG